MSVRNSSRLHCIGALLGLGILVTTPSPVRADPLFTAVIGPVANGVSTDPDPGRLYGGFYYDDNDGLSRGFRGEAGGYSTGYIQSGSFSEPATYTQTAFLRQANSGIPFPGTLISPLPGKNSTQQMGINALGHVIGYSFNPNGTTNPPDPRAFYFSSDQGTLALNTGQGPLEHALGINIKDQIVGQAHVAGGEIHGFYLPTPTSQGIDLNDVIGPHDGFTIVSAVAITKDGAIRGYAKDASGLNHFVTLTPITGSEPPAVPEPTTLAFFGLVSLSYAVGRLRRRIPRTLIG